MCRTFHRCKQTFSHFGRSKKRHRFTNCRTTPNPPSLPTTRRLMGIRGQLYRDLGQICICYFCALRHTQIILYETVLYSNVCV
ncbi:hypothetical protein XELAEV_18035969mg [Xenopus laevis]|uniref:Uncharacterized protein n=1 Tax=Xenopus laevis TaxID=8355 RepID=A0A974CGJ9_XENLA|nr:hypothetical protein XELAEV_18035969mg [Xenopus laevis]